MYNRQTGSGQVYNITEHPACSVWSPQRSLVRCTARPAVDPVMMISLEQQLAADRLSLPMSLEFPRICRTLQHREIHQSRLYCDATPRHTSVTLVTPTRWARNNSAPTDLSINCIKATFSLKLDVEQAAEVTANKHLLVLNILSIKYSIYDTYTLNTPTRWAKKLAPTNLSKR